MVGVDGDVELLRVGAARAAEENLGERLSFVVGDAYSSGLGSASLDACVSVSMFLHLVDSAAALREMVRVVRPGGKVICLDTSPPPPGPLRPFITIYLQTIIPLGDGSALRLTTALYYTPSGKTIHEKGIIPDIEVKDTELIEGKTAEELRDEALDRHMRGEGITDKAWDKPLTDKDLKQDPVLKKAVEILRHWPPKELAQKPSL